MRQPPLVQFIIKEILKKKQTSVSIIRILNN
jgi:hypothetical protein